MKKIVPDVKTAGTIFKQTTYKSLPMKTPFVQHGLSEVGKRLVALRRKSGYSNPADFAEAHGLAPERYRAMEQSTGTVTLVSLLQILEIHGLSLEDFFCADFKKLAA